jgi:acetylornithine deacetylase ArgE
MDATTLLRDLVSIPSVNPMGRALTGPEYFEHRVTAYLAELFRKLDVPCERQSVAPLRDNIVARFTNPGAKRTVILEAHQDTVPTDQMTIDPFAANIEGGRLYGRGACDVKGGMAAMLACFARLVREKPRGAANVIMACSVDEEHTFLGVKRLVHSGVPADVAIVAEPTCLNIVHTHKGAVRWNLTVRGRACHSSSPNQGVNAIYRMGRIVTAIERYAANLAASRPDPLLGPPTMSIGRIEGGTCVNVVPDWCRIEIDRRVIPGEDPLAAPRQLEDFLKNDAGIDFPFESAAPWLNKEALSPKGSEKLVADVGKAIDSVKGTHEVVAVPYGTDASNIAAAGIPAVVFGPGDIAQAHTKDEWISLAELEQAAEILYRFCVDA